MPKFLAATSPIEGSQDYADLLPTGFCDALGRLGNSDRWLDIGAGAAQAILDYYAPAGNTAPAEKCALSVSKARAVAMSIEDRRTDKWRKQAANVGNDRIRYLAGNPCGIIHSRNLESSR